eukprot:NODE_4928_length_743_cov_15.391931_g4572_i0.p1 GENE.NODE_4928_length_743_cov_15.391931_g4572_i0~~NODE_4928_length_743_cov_15.391931_g4572_i0.p1  ORF type:complete len:216 (-),score=59.99 NODE_4928_length_743_cov_15.391931_g4572_i0:66-713(-)
MGEDASLANSRAGLKNELQQLRFELVELNDTESVKKYLQGREAAEFFKFKKPPPERPTQKVDPATLSEIQALKHELAELERLQKNADIRHQAKNEHEQRLKEDEQERQIGAMDKMRHMAELRKDQIEPQFCEPVGQKTKKTKSEKASSVERPELFYAESDLPKMDIPVPAYSPPKKLEFSPEARRQLEQKEIENQKARQQRDLEVLRREHLNLLD